MFVGARLLEARGKTFDHCSSRLRWDTYKRLCRIDSRVRYYPFCTHTSLLECIYRTLVFRQ